MKIISIHLGGSVCRPGSGVGILSKFSRPRSFLFELEVIE